MDNLLFYHTRAAMTDKIKIFIKFNYFSNAYNISPLILIRSSYKSSIFTSYLQEGSSLVHFTFCIFLKTNKQKNRPTKIKSVLIRNG